MVGRWITDSIEPYTLPWWIDRFIVKEYIEPILKAMKEPINVPR